MKCAVEMGSGAIIYIQNSVKIDSDIQKLTAGGSDLYRQTDSMVISLL
jgi:hypothetical protein